MARFMRKLVKTCHLTAFLTSFVIVVTFIYLEDKAYIDQSKHLLDAVGMDQLNVKKSPGRSLLKYTFHHRKKQVDSLWETRLKFESWKQLFLNGQRGQVQESYTETTPEVTEKPTRPITTQSDTTPIYTESPTSPITTMSVTTPITTEPGQREVTTDKEKILLA